MQTFTNSACTAGAKEQRFLYAIGAGTAITPPDGVVLTRQANSFSTITHKVPVALNPGGLSYEVKYATRRRDRPRRRHLRPVHATRSWIATPAWPTPASLEPGSYVMVARVKNGGGGYFTPWSAPINFRVKAPFDLSYVGFLY